MGREKEYRQRLKYQVASVKKKTLEGQISNELEGSLGMSPTESRLLAARISSWLQSRPQVRGPEQIVVRATDGRDRFGRNTRRAPVKIKVTPYALEDLELELEMGLSALQTGRILRLIEEAYAQDALLSAKQIGELCNMTPTALRGRLEGIRQLGIWVPIQGLSREARRKGGLLRSTWAMSRFLSSRPSGETRQLVAISEGRWREIRYRFGALAGRVLVDNAVPEGDDPEVLSWVELIRQTPEPRLRQLIEGAPASSAPHAGCDDFFKGLAADFALSPAKVRALRELVEELKARLDGPREDNEVVYWTVAATESAGKPLSACRLVPVKLALTVPGDLADEPPNKVSGSKFAKIVRYATQAKYQGGYLTYADLSYLLGMHTQAISRLVKANPKLVVSLRGQECDIGRGVTHKKKIVELYLQLYTESEIVARTGHSYESIEAYIKEFAAVLVMSERGMGPTLIRRVLGKSLTLVKVYLDLVREYSTPEHAFRLAHMRELFLAHQGERQKRGPIL